MGDEDIKIKRADRKTGPERITAAWSNLFVGAAWSFGV